MALSTATVSFDLSDKVGANLNYRRAKVWVTTNVEVVHDTVGNKTRLGSGSATVNEDGTGYVTVWVPGTGSNPASWQTTIHVDYQDGTAPRGRRQVAFGPFTITASADLADLVAEQEIPPAYVSTVTAMLDTYVDSAAAAATTASASATSASTSATLAALVALGDADAALATALTDPATLTGGAAAGTFAKRALDEDGTPVVTTTSGETRILTPETASTRFAPREEALFIPGKAFDALSGSPNYATMDTGNVSAWMLDDGTAINGEGLTALFTIPDHWATITTVEVWWVPPTAAGGNVIWSLNVFDLGHNLALTAGGSSTLVSAAQSAGTTANRARVSAVASTFAVEPVKVQRISVRRDTANALDTVTGDIGFIGVKIIGGA